MHSLRSRLIAAFVVATLVPLGATIWITASLLDRSLGYATTEELDGLSRTLEGTMRQFYERERTSLRQDAIAGRIQGTRFEAGEMAAWPEAVRSFWESGDTERFALGGTGGDRLEFMTRQRGSVSVHRRDLGGIHMQELAARLRQARETVGATEGLDLRRGFTLTLLVLVAAVWVISLAPLMFLAHRISRPIQGLTAALTRFAGGQWDQRLDPAGHDEVGNAVEAFNHMAGQLRRNRDRLVYLTQMSSWQSLARKTAHELKNSLTPIRLTVEEMVARQPSSDRAFMQQAADIVISEIETLERRVRAFSEFASEPPVSAETFDLNVMVTERIALLTPAHPQTTYLVRLDPSAPWVQGGGDLVKGILTNLLDNGAEAAGPGGTVETTTRLEGDQVVVDVQDSGPGLGPDAARTLFEPTITFKKHGMGLGLSIARKNALLLGGDVTLVGGTLGGAAFRVVLPAADRGPATA
jgi:nitrogen fixation/metabolism regulation signal transduction histidine kinase